MVEVVAGGCQVARTDPPNEDVILPLALGLYAPAEFAHRVVMMVVETKVFIV